MMAVGQAISFWPEYVNTVVHDTSKRVAWDWVSWRFCIITPVDTEPPAAETPRSILGGKAPVLRPTFDHIAENRLGATGDTIRTIRSVQKSQEETTRQELQEVKC